MVVKCYIVYYDNIDLEYIKLKIKMITTDQMISLNNHNIKRNRFSYLIKTLEALIIYKNSRLYSEHKITKKSLKKIKTYYEKITTENQIYFKKK